MSLSEQQGRGTKDSQNPCSGYANVDCQADPRLLIRSLDAISAVSFYKDYKRHTTDLLDLHESDLVLDVGCGSGNDTRAIASLLGPKGLVVGTDASWTMINEAQNRNRGISLPIGYCVSNAHNLGFADNTFDACRADRVFQHLEDPQQALVEMIRVTRPGARILVVDPDHETLVIDSPDRVTTRKIINFLCDEGVRNGWIAHQLPALFKAQGLVNISVSPQTMVLTDYSLANNYFRLENRVQLAYEAGIITRDEASGWVNCMGKTDQEGKFFFALTFFITYGQKPRAEPNVSASDTF
jgi:ubiquinone/menaquinone biosynthesis C-methylase UbiE